MSIGLEEIAIAGAAALGLLALIHAALALGMRLGYLAWGSVYPILLRPLRFRSAIAALFLGFAAWVLASMTTLVEVAPVPDNWMRSTLWVVTAFVGVGAFTSFASRSKGERWLIGPLAAIGAIAAGLLTFG